MKHVPRLAAVALAAALAGPAFAGIDSQGGGDYGVVPLYRALVFGGIDRGGDGTYDANDVTGLDYASNVAPRTYASTNGSFAADGATLSTTGWSAYSGFYAARTYASMTVTNTNPADGYYIVAGQGTATSVRFYTPEAAAGSAVFTFHIGGTSSNPSAVGTATSRLDFAASTDPSKNWIGLFDGSLGQTLSVFGAGTYTYTLPIADLGQQIDLYFWTSAFTEVRAGQAPAGSSFTLTADYGHTVVLENVELRDAADAPVGQWSLADAAGGETLFTQDGRIAPIAPAPVPEPTTWALMLAGLAVMLRIAQRGPAPAR